MKYPDLSSLVSLVQHRTTGSCWRAGLCLTRLYFTAVYFLNCWTNKNLWYYYYYYYCYLLNSFNGFPVSSSVQRSLCQHFKLLKLFVIYYVLNADNVTCKGCRLKERHLCRCDLCFLQAALVRILSFHICKSQVGGLYRLFNWFSPIFQTSVASEKFSV